MTPEEAKQELSSYSYDYCYYEQKARENEQLKVQLARTSERLSENAHKPVHMEELLQKQVEEENVLFEILTNKQKIERKIEGLKQPFRTVLYLRYIALKTFDEIAEIMHYSTKRIYQLHREGVSMYAEQSTETEQSGQERQKAIR